MVLGLHSPHKTVVLAIPRLCGTAWYLRGAEPQRDELGAAQVPVRTMQVRQNCGILT